MLWLILACQQQPQADLGAAGAPVDFRPLPLNNPRELVRLAAGHPEESSGPTSRVRFAVGFLLGLAHGADGAGVRALVEAASLAEPSTTYTTPDQLRLAQYTYKHGIDTLVDVCQQQGI